MPTHTRVRYDFDPQDPTIDVLPLFVVVQAIFWMHSLEVVTGLRLAHSLSYYELAAIEAAASTGDLLVKA
jgi:hypothetical protein